MNKYIITFYSTTYGFYPERWRQVLSLWAKDRSEAIGKFCSIIDIPNMSSLAYYDIEEV